MALKTTKFDIQDHLNTLEQQAAYLEAALTENDPSFIATAISDVIRARGIASGRGRGSSKDRC
ncbi:hypothetical protein CI1B_67800 [Bradyrhizobium ivorense]|uniref:Transcriptional regulator n=1 Tax=Bradyrhizobium ivorense TaxID=2511166 RepID=A0A508TRI5_9BRAD|nr:hypothetical protein [Bradyrhizobium ivorense]VIO76901.1 hypothetical protein CI1B_67800 [Bradyrhizobium ivorense]